MRRQGPPGGLAAVLALAGVVGLWGVRDYEHRRAVGALAHNDPEQAKRKQNEAADALQQLAQKLAAKTPDAAKAPAGEKEPPQGMPNKEQTAQARDLAKQQRELREQSLYGRGESAIMRRRD